MNESGSASEHEEDDQDSENDQLDDDVMLAMVVVAVTASWRNRRRAPQPMHNSRLTGSMRVEDEFIRPPDYTAVQHLILEHSDKYRPWFDVRYRCDLRENVDVNADYMFDDGIDGTGPSTGTQQHDSRRGAMNQMRDMIADDMWERYQSSPWYKSM
ncbi:hypothetical protein TIFTF001_022680 [Ficus carica]|uniref:Uncharacterized protein n=1 Tax=Ficus carica TaxID=3494 RepID=A0AA88AJK0_FICCA|nr:hypothetical protein TIFTF001_022680 [Ficus carica]